MAALLVRLCKLADAEQERTGEREPLRDEIEGVLRLEQATRGLDEHLSWSATGTAETAEAGEG